MEEERQQAEQVAATGSAHSEQIQLKTTKILTKLAGATMQRHGCLVEQGRITLPIGSTRTLCEPSLTMRTRWYDIVLPDQYRIREVYDLRRGLSILFWRPE